MFTVNKKGKSALQWDKVVDSANKTDYGTGSQRDSQDMKGRYDLIPTGPIHRLAQHYENGAAKYAERNWEKGQPLHQYYNSAIRHLQALRDADLSEDHAAAAVWNIVAIMHHVDAMLTGKLPDHLDTFGILAAIRKHEEQQITLEQVKEHFSNPEHKPTIKPMFGNGKIQLMASGMRPDYPINFDPFSSLPEYQIPDGVKVVYDKDRFKDMQTNDPYTPKRDYSVDHTDNNNFRPRRTIKLDPEELG